MQKVYPDRKPERTWAVTDCCMIDLAIWWRGIKKRAVSGERHATWERKKRRQCPPPNSNIRAVNFSVDTIRLTNKDGRCAATEINRSNAENLCDDWRVRDNRWRLLIFSRARLKQRADSPLLSLGWRGDERWWQTAPWRNYTIPSSSSRLYNRRPPNETNWLLLLLFFQTADAAAR